MDDYKVLMRWRSCSDFSSIEVLSEFASKLVDKLNKVCMESVGDLLERARQGRGIYMSIVSNEASRGSEVPLRAFCCKARGGGGRLRQATKREEREEKKKQEEKIK